MKELSCERYEIIELIGVGGMGRVYKARDPRLNRFVALKFIRGDDHDTLRRFSQEAQTQAKIEHGNICKVYEVGEIEGLPYIAMQYIEGRSLKEVKAELSLEQKVKVIKEVAEALQAAHRIGLIHRDIKPANIMMERGEEGWHPYVMDFGLAREIEDKDRTVTGAILGTPAYMAPEQALADSEHLDRRTDIYCLGATFYDLLCGQPPFASASVMEMMVKLVREEPTAPHRLNRTIPADLETIVMKCLEKEPSRRYESARALAEDLQNYLDGEPISARRASFTYRLIKRARKNRFVTLMAMVATLAIVLSTGLAVQSRLKVAEATRLAQQFGQEVKEIEGIMERAYFLPLHDTRAERALVRSRMQAIELMMKPMGSTGTAAGYYALGRGSLALRDYDNARQQLEEAWRLGYRTPEAGYALGQALGALYQSALGEAQRIEVKELRQARIKELERQYREPALNYLRSSAGSKSVSPLYIEGLIAFYERRYDEVLTKSEQAFQQTPWLYEAKQLAGELYLVKGREKQERGDLPGAFADYEEAGINYAAAMEMARSDASVYEGECQRCIEIMEVEVKRGGDFQSAFDKGLAACDRALAANPDSVQAYTRKARLYWRLALQRSIDGGDALAVLNRAVEMAEAALRLDPGDVDTIRSLGLIYEVMASFHNQRGGDPRAPLDRAINYFSQAAALDAGNGVVYFNMGNAYLVKAEFESAQGQDPRASLQQARASHERAIELLPDFAFAYKHQGAALMELGNYQYKRGEDPRGWLDQAIASYRQALRLNPNYLEAWAYIGLANLAKSRYLLERGSDPTPAISAATAAFARATEINAKIFWLYLEQAEANLVAARWLMAQGKSAHNYFAEAGHLLARAVELNANFANTYRSVARLHLLEAEAARSDSKKAQQAIARGQAMAARALEINPRLAEARALQGLLLVAESRWEQNGARRVDKVTRAIVLLERAINENQLLRRDYEPHLKSARDSLR